MMVTILAGGADSDNLASLLMKAATKADGR